MSELFEFPEIKFDRGEVPMLRTPLPATEERLRETQALFGMEGEADDQGARLVLRAGDSTLEFFPASGSVWWTRQQRLEEERFEEVRLPGEDEAIELANRFLEEHRLLDPNATVTSVTYSEVSRLERKTEKPRSLRDGVQVNYGFTQEGLPVFGPGAKMQVSMGVDGEVFECFKFWRETRPEDTRPLVDLDAAKSLLMRDTAFSQLRPEESRVRVREVDLGYYAMPPRELQSYLIPCYVFKAAVTTPHLEADEFNRYVMAVKIDPAEGKRTGFALRELTVAA